MMNQTARSGPANCCSIETCCYCCRCACYQYRSPRSPLVRSMRHSGRPETGRPTGASRKTSSPEPPISRPRSRRHGPKYHPHRPASLGSSTATPRTSEGAPPAPTSASIITSGQAPTILFTCTLVLTMILQLISIANGVVVHQIRFIENKTGRTDYALVGETIELSCYYMMKDEAEDVKQIIWSKDGKNFLKWRKSKAGLEVLNYTFKGHIDQTSINSHLIIHNVTIDMHGKYRCQVKTDLGMHELEHDLIVISQSGCKPNDWRISSDQMMCREQFRLDCRNMFPKPVPSCGLWNDRLDKFIRSVTVDISEEPNKETYRVKYLDKFDLPNQSGPQPTTLVTNSTTKGFDNQRMASGLRAPPTGAPTAPVTSYNTDLLQYAGHLTFKCDIIIPETSWRLSLAYKMFDYLDGCYLDPLETVERMRLNYSHFAATRMQQAGHLPTMDQSSSSVESKLATMAPLAAGRHGSKAADELEMLASSLKYELIPSPRSKSPKVELNCWQKPKPGTLARLSCAKSNHVKLIGTNLLECRSDGQWHPISLAVSNKILAKSGTLASSHQAARKIPRKYRSDEQQKQPGNQLNRSTRAEDSPATSTQYPDVGQVSAGPVQPHGPSDIGAEEKYNKPVDNNDAKDTDGDDNDDSTTTNKTPTTEIEESISEQSIPATATPAATTTTTEITTTTTTTMEPSSSYEPIESHLELSNLTPAQLAALLPNCVSTINRGPKFQHHRLSTSASGTNNHHNNRLMPQDEAVVLESHYSQHGSKFQPISGVQYPSSKYQQEHQGATSNGNIALDSDPFNWNWFSVLASSSSSSTTTINSNQRSLVLFTSWLAAMVLVLHNLSFANRAVPVA